MALRIMAGAFSQVQREVHQTPSQRRPLLRAIQKLRGGRAVVSFFNRFNGDFPLSHTDADMIEEVLCNTDCSKGVTLILDAPGGDGLAAERIIQVCRSYSGTSEFETIVPARAKSAATMVCLGANKILLSPTSELGPIDPQIYRDIGLGRPSWVAAEHYIKSYDALFKEAVSLSQGHIEPYLQQLGKFNVVDIQSLRTAQQLSVQIAVSSLRRGMLSGKSDADITALIKPFTDPTLTLAHGRALNHENCTACQLAIELMALDSRLWKNVWDLYMRSKFVVESTNTCKLVESVTSSNSMTVAL